MAIQIFPQKEQGFLGSLGTGLGQGLQALAQIKANQLLQQQSRAQMVPGLQSIGFAPEQASALAFLPEAVQKEVVKQQLLAPQQQAYASALQELLGGQPAAQPSGIQALQQQFQPQEPMAAGSPAAQPMSAQAQQAGISQALAKQPRLTEQQATKLAELGLKKQAHAEKLKSEAFKQTKEERKEIIGKARAAKQNLHDLERLEELEKEGKLDTPGYVQFLERSGLDIPALMNPGSEEFNKIAANFIRDAKSIFGARVSNYEIEQFLKTIPSLSQSPEGRKRVIANLKYVARGNLEYNNALKEVMAENKGIPPLDLAEQIDDKIDKKLDLLTKKFKQDLAKPVPEGQAPLATALQSIAGSVLGAPGKLLGSVGSALGGLGKVFVG